MALASHDWCRVARAWRRASLVLFLAALASSGGAAFGQSSAWPPADAPARTAPREVPVAREAVVPTAVVRLPLDAVSAAPAGSAIPAPVANGSKPTADDGAVLTAVLRPGSTLAATASMIEKLELENLWKKNSATAWWTFVIAAAAGLIAGRVAGAFLAFLGKRFQKRGWTILARMVFDLAGPASLAILTFALSLGVVQLSMSTPLHDYWRRSMVLLYSLSVFWYMYNVMAVVDIAFRRLQAHRESVLDKQLAPLVRRTLRSFVLFLAALFIVESVFNQDVGAWLAGLGIAGLALSLAAQDSLKNLFGSITILLDRPFQVGDRIVFSGFDGVIEDIGLRSTKVRTATGHVVTIPNSKIVNDPVENISRRPYIRRSFNVTVPATLPKGKIDEAVRILRGILEEEGICEPIHPIIEGDAYPPRVYLTEFTDEKVTIAVTYWFAPPKHWDFQAHAQKVNLRVFERLAEARIAFGLPTTAADATPPKSAGPDDDC